MLDTLFLAGFVVAAATILWASRSLATGVVHLLFGLALSGSALALWGIPGWTWTYRNLQGWLLLGLVLTAAYAWLTVGRHQRADWPGARLLAVLAPMGVLAVMFLATRLLASDAGGPLTGVGYLVTRSGAEDNAKWLNATAQLATGGDVLSQDTAVGAPLLMVMVVAATAISVLSTILYGGVNQVAVAADTLILTQHLLVIAAPLALAPLATATWTLKRRRAREQGLEVHQQVPALALWTGMGILAATSILLTRYGHLTLQFILIVFALWLTAFLAPPKAARVGLLATLTVIACSQVWFPINVLATVLILAALVVTIGNVVRARRSKVPADWVSLAVTVVMALLIAGYLASSIRYALGAGTETALPLFAISGGTEVVTPLLLGLVGVGVFGAASLLTMVVPSVSGRWSRFVPIWPVVVLLGYAVAVTMVDFWATGTGPGYGSRKMMFGVAIAITAATIPLAITRLDVGRAGLTMTRLAAVAAVGFVLIADTILPRALVEIRPQVWPAAGEGTYWGAAEVRPTGDQPLSSIPISCVYIRGDRPIPAAYPWDDAQNLGQTTYSCTRLLVGLAGLEKDARPIVDWLIDEWTNGKSTWSESSKVMAGLPAEVRARDWILLDAYARPLGPQSIDRVLVEYPAWSPQSRATQTP